MKIPKSIKIGCHKVPIEYPYIFTERYDNYGQFDAAHMKIYLGDTDASGTKRTDSAVFVILVHEILHAIEYITNWKVFEACGDKEDNAVQAFAECIAQILIDNKFVNLE